MEFGDSSPIYLGKYSIIAPTSENTQSTNEDNHKTTMYINLFT